MSNALLIYDDQCSYCKPFVKAVRMWNKNNELEFLNYSSIKTKNLLKLQFPRKTGFTMYLFDLEENRVSWAEQASEDIVNMLGMPKIIVKTTRGSYPSFFNIFSKLTGKKRKAENPCADCLKQPFTDMYSKIKKKAKERLKKIL